MERWGGCDNIVRRVIVMVTCEKCLSEKNNKKEYFLVFMLTVHVRKIRTLQVIP